MIINKFELKPRTCVNPKGNFIYGLHQPGFDVANLRMADNITSIGSDTNDQPVSNSINYPSGDIHAPNPQEVFEIANPLPFRGTTYIGKQWADTTAEAPGRITIEKTPPTSLSKSLGAALVGEKDSAPLIRIIIRALPHAVKLAVATTSNDPEDLIALAENSCEFIHDPQSDLPIGLSFRRDTSGRVQPIIHDHRLFDSVANNPHLPDDYKKVMVLKPGVQGENEIVGEWRSSTSHIYEYLRTNSYIPWGHYAANMAEDAIRYDACKLSTEDMIGLRHLYYQRTYVRMAEALGIDTLFRRITYSDSALEKLRCDIVAKMDVTDRLPFTATLWGWNYGFDYAPNGYRLHASHQQIHQQYALIPESVSTDRTGDDNFTAAFACGDMVQAFVRSYRQHYGKGFFDCYLQAISNNKRMDGRNERSKELVVHSDDQIMLFVPKAQTSQWELQLMAVPRIGNILEADEPMRNSLDTAILLAMQLLGAMGADMVTVIEYSKRFRNCDDDQRLLYAFLPRLPESPGAFSEAQLRWINGHYPEDFAQACRLKMKDISKHHRETDKA